MNSKWNKSYTLVLLLNLAYLVIFYLIMKLYA